MKQYFVYRNLRTNTFSLKYGGKVILHPKELLMYEANFNVSEKGRQKVIATKRKNVHATISSHLIRVCFDTKFKVVSQIYYNPYITAYFSKAGVKVTKLPLVLLKDNKIYEVKEVR